MGAVSAFTTGNYYRKPLMTDVIVFHILANESMNCTLNICLFLSVMTQFCKVSGFRLELDILKIYQ